MNKTDSSAVALARIADRITKCEHCPRLREYCAEVAVQKRRSFRDQTYWGKPVPGFGDPQARLFVVGLAPAAHGGNRTGRVFTGDPSGDFLYAALHRYKFANQPISESLDDGLVLKDAYVSAAGRCAPPQNKPTREELDNCRPYLAQELAALPSIQVVVALGLVGWEAMLKMWVEAGHRMPKPKPRFGHLAEMQLDADVPLLLGSYHPSQRNTQTGLLTRPMFHSVFARAKKLLR